jgi:hypothetical protein
MTGVISDNSQSIRHGTTAGYNQHRRKKIPVCVECRAAQQSYSRAYYGANREELLEKQRAYRAANPEKIAEGNRAYRAANPEKLRAYYEANREKMIEKQKIRRFGITSAEYDQMVMAQCGTCGICGEPEAPKTRLSVDHDHDTGKLRGLLCGSCNRGIGLLQDSPELLNRASAYLTE